WLALAFAEGSAVPACSPEQPLAAAVMARVSSSAEKRMLEDRAENAECNPRPPSSGLPEGTAARRLPAPLPLPPRRGREASGPQRHAVPGPVPRRRALRHGLRRAHAPRPARRNRKPWGRHGGPPAQIL